MAEREPKTAVNIRAQHEDGQLLAGDAAQVLPWSLARARLAESASFWLSTVRPDGQPQTRPVLAVWVDGSLYSTTNPTTAKGRNLTINPRFSLATITDGIDLVVEGEARRVTDSLALLTAGLG